MIFAPLEHADYSLVDTNCECPVCVDWRTKFEAFKKIQPLVEGHDRGLGGAKCKCSRCCEMRRIRSLYLAALNRRDFYCEMAWHAGHHPSGQEIMAWATREIRDSNHSFWYMVSPRMTIGDWLSRFNTAIASGVVSSFAGLVADCGREAREARFADAYAASGVAA